MGNIHQMPDLTKWIAMGLHWDGKNQLGLAPQRCSRDFGGFVIPAHLSIYSE